MARFRFKALIRKVLLNAHWLIQVEEAQLGENIKRNVNIIWRKKGKEGLLTINELKIVNTKLEERTQEQTELLRKAFMKLSCFEKYHAKTKMQVMDCCHFQCVSKGRTILKEGHRPIACYFILYGEIEVTKMFWDKVKLNFDTQ